MPLASVSDIQNNISSLQSLIKAFDCGERYTLHNDLGIPFYCDIQHAVPTAHQVEWEYLEVKTDLWQLRGSKDQDVTSQLRQEKTSRSGATCSFRAQVLSR